MNKDRKGTMDLFWRMIEDSFERPELYPDNLTVIALSDAIKSRVFTPGRLQLVKALREKPALSVSDLAKRVRRPLASVSRDLKVLQTYGVVRLRRSGRVTVPTLIPAHIVIPLAANSSTSSPVSAEA